MDTPPFTVLAFNWPVTTERKIVLQLSKARKPVSLFLNCEQNCTLEAISQKIFKSIEMKKTVAVCCMVLFLFLSTSRTVEGLGPMGQVRQYFAEVY